MHSPAGVFTTDGNELAIDLSESVYSRNAVLRTAYWFTDKCYLYIARPSPQVFRVHFKAKPSQHGTSDTLGEVAGEFLNALLDHQLRDDIESQTGQIRELLVAKALAEAGLLEDTPPGDPRDPVDEAHARNSGFIHIEPPG